jgi:hypothetical protein
MNSNDSSRDKDGDHGKALAAPTAMKVLATTAATKTSSVYSNSHGHGASSGIKGINSTSTRIGDTAAPAPAPAPAPVPKQHQNSSNNSKDSQQQR